MSDPRIYTFSDVVLTVGDLRFLVSSVNIMLSEGGIPEMRVTIDPAHSPDDTPNDVTTVTLGTLDIWNRYMNNAAANRETAAFTMKIAVTSTLGVVENQDLDLQDWVITAAGLQASASGAFGLEVTIQHPIVKVDSGCLNFGNILGSAKDITAADSAASIPLALSQGIRSMIDRAVLNIGLVPLQSGTIDMRPVVLKYLNHVKDAANVLDQTLLWDPSVYSYGGGNYQSWPVPSNAIANSNKPYATYVARSVARYGANVALASIWELISQAVAPDLSVCVIPTYWEPALKLVPYSPWLPPALSLLAEDISEVRFPGKDSAPVIGALMTYAKTPMVLDSTTFVKDFTQSMLSQNSILYMPLENSADLDTAARLITVTPPKWLMELRSDTSGAGTAVRGQHKQQKGKDTAFITPGTVRRDTKAPDESGGDFAAPFYKGIMLNVCKQIFYARFMSTVGASFRTRLLVTVPEEQSNTTLQHLIPGMCVSAAYEQNDATGEKGELFMEAYVTNVDHTIDCQRGLAYTDVTVRYARPSGGVVDVLKTDDPAKPATNPLYTI